MDYARLLGKRHNRRDGRLQVEAARRGAHGRAGPDRASKPIQAASAALPRWRAADGRRVLGSHRLVRFGRVVFFEKLTVFAELVPISASQ